MKFDKKQTRTNVPCTWICKENKRYIKEQQIQTHKKTQNQNSYKTKSFFFSSPECTVFKTKLWNKPKSWFTGYTVIAHLGSNEYLQLG